MSDTPLSTPLSDLLGVKPMNGLVGAVNQTYSYASNSLFGAMLPHYVRDYYYRAIRPACQWIDGYVPAIHTAQTGIISTRIAGRLLTGLTKQICGERLIFKRASKEANYDTVKFISKWAEDNNAMKAVYASIGYALGVGTSCIKINKRADGELWLEAVRFDNCFFDSSFSGVVNEATFFLQSYINTTKDDGDRHYVLVEKRYYETEKVGKIEAQPDGTFKEVKKKFEKTPMVVYKCYWCKGSVMTNLSQAQAQPVTWKQLPEKVRKMIHEDYSALVLDNPQKLGLANLGVEVMRNGECDLCIPTGTTFGEGLIIGIQNDLLDYEIASSYLLRDAYNGKGTVYVPKQLNINDYNPMGMPQDVPLSGFGESKVEMVKGVSPEDQKIMVEQFQVRVQEWQTMKDNALRNIASKWGMAGKVLSSYLAVSSVTATQVDSEDDMSIAFISHTRSYFKHALDKIFETVLNYYGKPNDVSVGFASPSLVNKDRILQRVTAQLEAGLTTIEDAVRELNPDLDEEDLQTKIDTAKKMREEMMLQSQTEFNQEGSFNE